MKIQKNKEILVSRNKSRIMRGFSIIRDKNKIYLSLKLKNSIIEISNDKKMQSFDEKFDEKYKYICEKFIYGSPIENIKKELSEEDRNFLLNL